MAEEKNIIYSAIDIERYHKKLLSAKEMHAMEKAALDDPFLADALEGYGDVATDVQKDIGLLREKLEKRVSSETKVVPLKSTGFTWLRVAALVIVIAGAGLLAYQFIFTNKNNDVAKTEAATEKQQSPAVSDTNKATVSQVPQGNNSNGRSDSSADNTVIVKDEEAAIDKLSATTVQKEKVASTQNRLAESKETKTEVANPAPSELNNDAQYKTKPTVEVKAQAKKADDVKISQPEPEVLNETVQFRSKAYNKQAQNDKDGYNFSRPNVFRGQIMDANNTPLPFANVTNTKDGVGTYTDVKGNFTLVSQDSLLNVQVRSVGFENASSQLQNNVSANAIVLQQDTSVTPATVLSNKQFNTERLKRSTLTVEEPEPYDGWYNYDTYLANNISIPEEQRSRISPGAEVELSFDISKDGEPINIKIEKSACKECDTEAIRLLKEGPKWKKKKRNKRARLNVAF